MDSRAENLKVIVLGASATGKTCLTKTLLGEEFLANHQATAGCEFRSIRRNFGQDQAYQLELRDAAGHERYAGLLGIYIKNADVVLIALNPQEEGEWQAQIQKFTEIVRKVSQNAEISYVVTHADKFDELNFDPTIYDNIKKAHQPRKDHGNEEPKIFAYSSANLELETEVDGQPITRKNLLLNALDAAAVEKIKVIQAEAMRNKKEELQPIDIQDPSYFTWSGFFKAVLLFMGLSVVFLSLGGIAGGLEHIWPNIDGLFAAIQLGTDWGIGVTVASLGLALIITGAAVAWDYYCSHRGGENKLPQFIQVDSSDDDSVNLSEDEGKQNRSKTPQLIQVDYGDDDPVNLSENEGKQKRSKTPQLEISETKSSPVVSQPNPGDNKATELVIGSWYKVTALQAHQPKANRGSEFFILSRGQTFYAKVTSEFGDLFISFETTDGKSGMVTKEKVHLEAVTEEEAMQHQVSNVQKLTN